MVTENEDAKYTISVDYSDYSGNAADTVVKQFIVDKTDPVIKVDYSNNDVRNDKYFNADRMAKITIIEHNFNSDDVELNVTNDKAVNDISDFATYLKNPYSWTIMEIFMWQKFHLQSRPIIHLIFHIQTCQVEKIPLLIMVILKQ